MCRRHVNVFEEDSMSTCHHAAAEARLFGIGDAYVSTRSTTFSARCQELRL